MDFEAREGVAWGTGSTQVEKSEDVRDVGSCEEELVLKAPGSLVFREWEHIGNGGWHGMEGS